MWSSLPEKFNIRYEVYFVLSQRKKILDTGKESYTSSSHKRRLDVGWGNLVIDRKAVDRWKWGTSSSWNITMLI